MKALSSTLAVVLAAGLALMSAAPASMAEQGGEDAVHVDPSGEALIRYRHVEGKNFGDGGDDDFVTQRVRLGVRLGVGGVLGVFGQIQDVRIWGTESDTLQDFSADGLDLHQGYLILRPAPGAEIRLGRQEIAMLNHRVIGTVGWLEQARSFDAARFRFAPPDSKLVVDAFYARTLHMVADDDGRPDDVFAATGSYKVSPAFVPSALVVVDLNSSSGRSRGTIGLHAKGKTGYGLGYEAEGYLQVGSADNDVSYMAFFTGLHVRYTAAVDTSPFLELFFELASGDDDPSDGDRKTFDTLFATNHKFYGEMDVFLNLPVHTAQRGLMDMGAKVGFKPLDRVAVDVAAHFFQAADDQGGEGNFGIELDTRVHWKVHKHFRLAAVLALFLPGDGLKPDGDTEVFSYVTAAATL